MRSSKSRSRNKSSRQRTLVNVVNRVFDSSGPEGKVRGTPQQIIEKYTALARDAQLSNDRVAEQSFLQHAEHYTRMLGEAMREQAERQQNQPQQQGWNGQQNGREDDGDDRVQQQPRRDDQGDRQDRQQQQPRRDDQGDRQDRQQQQPRRDDQGERQDRQQQSDRQQNDRQDRGDRQQYDRGDRQDRSDRPQNDRQQNDRPDRDDRPRNNNDDRPRNNNNNDDRLRERNNQPRQRRDDQPTPQRQPEAADSDAGLPWQSWASRGAADDAGPSTDDTRDSGLPDAVGFNDADADAGPLTLPEHRSADRPADPRVDEPAVRALDDAATDSDRPAGSEAAPDGEADAAPRDKRRTPRAAPRPRTPRKPVDTAGPDQAASE